MRNSDDSIMHETIINRIESSGAAISVSEKFSRDDNDSENRTS